MITDIKIPGFYSYSYTTDKYYIHFYKKDQHKYYYNLYYEDKHKMGCGKEVGVVDFWIKEKRLKELTEEDKLELL